jgi:extracellular elastinolytic metalloproteinase
VPIDLDGDGVPDFFLPLASVNGSDDPSVVYHEYTHGLSNRLITDAQGFGATYGIQSGAMGEAWSDWYALDLLAQERLITDGPEQGDVREGGYVDNDSDIIRTEPTDCLPDDNTSDACHGFEETGPGGYTYQDFGLIAFGAPGGSRISEVHSDGEIWAQTLWQLRQELVKRYGQQRGSRQAEAIVTAGMRLGPPSPSFLDQRNAILQADTVLHQGADRDLIWKVFAARGMGYFASTRGDYDDSPEADFSPPPAANGPTGTLHGVVTNDASQPVAGALVGLGGHDGPPGAGPALQAVTAADGSYTISGIPQAEYPQVTIDAPDGYADASFGPVTIAGAPVSKDMQVRRNFADSHNGATITSNARDDRPWGCGWPQMIDGNQATVMETAAPDPSDPSTYRTFTVRLSQPVDGAEVWIDPSAGCGSIQPSGLAGYDVELSTDGTTFQPAASGTFDRTSDAKTNRVPLKNVPNGVRAVRLVARSTQGDAVAAPLDDAGTLNIAELEVFGRPGGTPPGGGGGGGGSTPAAKLKPKLTMNRHKRTVSRKTRRTTVKLRCVRATRGVPPKRCKGLLFISGGKKGRKALARRTFSVPSLKTVTVRLKLTRKAVRILKRHPIETRLHARVVNTGAGTRRATYPIKVRLAKKKKG